MTFRSFACTVAFVWLAAACGSKHGTGTPDASIVCGLFGQPCALGGDCCSGVCDPQGGCTVNPTTCSAPGTTCSTGTDCCSVSCVGSVCQNACTADSGSCTTNGQCCSGECGSGGTCTPLSTTCKTSGNPCGANAECCGGFCNAGGTCGNASWCVVNGNSCSHDAECCGGICNIASGGTIGTCAQPSPGATNCSAGIDGQLCNTCGDCCSALCEIYGPTGVQVCQPAEGCRVDGDICHADGDCCGAAGTGLPGDGNVVCAKNNPADLVGICRNPTGCNPEGDTCHYLGGGTSGYACDNSTKRNDCCAAPGNSGVCQLDALGVPRCFGLGSACVATGGNCAYNGDCCNGEPCVPNGSGQLVCGATCVNTTGMCTSTGDCCNGLTCVFTPGQEFGTCGGGTGSGSGSATCAQSGQSCSDMNPCCPGSMCNVSGTTTACPAGMETGCVCDGNIIQ